MSRGVNKVILVGRLGADPEMRATASGTAVCNLRIATSEQWNDKQSGEKQERTEWHSVTLFGKLAEIAGTYLQKGKQVYIEGSLRTDEYEKDGVKRWSTKIIGSDMQMLGGVGSESQQQRKDEQQAQQQHQQPYTGKENETFDDDDIPF